MNKRKGFTLIELIVAVLFFGIASASIAIFYAGNSRRVLDSERSARLEVAAERAYEGFKGTLMERMYEGSVYSQLVFDSIWVNFNVGDTVFAITDNISGVLFNSNIVIDSFHFDTTKAATKDEAKTFDTGSRVWETVISMSHGDTIEMQTVFSHHR